MIHYLNLEMEPILVHTMIDGMQKMVLLITHDNSAWGVCDLCAEYNFSREDQDNFAIQSYEQCKHGNR
jgi:acetyl-CoA C-acetyltransferase